MATAMKTSSMFGSSLKKAVVSPFRPAVVSVSRPAVQVHAMAEKTKGPKRMDSAVKRALLGKERRLYNKARKSACATRIKKVVKAATDLLAAPPSAADAIVPLEKLISEATQEVDKAVNKGVLHKNNGARKKSRMARYKRMVLMAAGLFTPSADHPDFAKYQRLQAKKATA